MRFSAALQLLWFLSFAPICRKCWKRLNFTFDDLCQPDLWLDLKIDLIDFMIFDGLSNAAYCVSLRDPGAELDGSVQIPPARCVRRRAPARRGLSRAPLRVIYSPLSRFFFLISAILMSYQRETCSTFRTINCTPYVQIQISYLKLILKILLWPNFDKVLQVTKYRVSTLIVPSVCNWE